MKRVSFLIKPASSLCNPRCRYCFYADEAQKRQQASSWRMLCNGGCKNDWIHTSDGNHNYYCPVFRMLFEHAGERMFRIAQAEYMQRQRL